MDVFDLAAKISLDTSEYEKGLDGAESKAESFGSKLRGGLGKAAKIGAGAVAAIGTASIAAGAAFVKGIDSVAAFGDNIDKMSQKMGMSSDAYQEWDAVMRHSGTSMEAMKASMKTLANAAESGSDAFEKLGISQEEIANLSQEQLFERTISALQNVEDETQRTYLAGKTLGRGATELGALLNTSAEDTEKMRKRVRELGGVMSGKAVKQAAKFKDSLQDMQTAISGVKNKLLSSFMRPMRRIMDGITEVFAGDSDKGIGMITNGVDRLVKKLGKKLPEMMSTAGKLLSAFGTAIATNLPKLMTSAVNFVITALPGAITGLLSIVIPALTSLVSSVSSALPGLLTGVIDSIKNIITGNAGVFADQGVTLLTSIASGIAGAVGAVGSAIGNIITSIGTWIDTNKETLKTKGGEIWDKIVSGISEDIGNTGETLASLGEKILEWINGDGLASLQENGTALWDTIMSGITTAIATIGEGLGGILTGIASWVVENWDAIKQAGVTIMKTIISGVVTAAGDIITGMLTLLATAIAWIYQNRDTIINVGKTILSNIVSGIITFVQLVWDGLVELVSTILGWFTDHGSDLEDAGKTIVTGIKDGIVAFLDRIKAGLNKLVEKLVSAVKGMNFLSVGLAIVNGIVKGLGKALGSLVTGLDNLIKNAIAKIESKGYTIHPKINAKTGVVESGAYAGHNSEFAKAKNRPYLFTKGTVFGRYNGENLIAGEAGPEMLLGVNKLNAMLYQSVQGGMQSMMGQMAEMMQSAGAGASNASAQIQQEILNVLNTYFPQVAAMQLVLDTGAVAGAVAPGVNQALGSSVSNRRRDMA